ncbi:two-component regulator propeller domain-containing protein [Spirosoma sp. KNUC1025]|uniref:ligand-binding sensor domain-containing protein n=1 Tax=Spirosoma sp. KNUC1025 TaxID=2894082 RepID=UPI00386EC470|nr:hypothetical protein LN737_20795 [Spirosoma sp. KNUC1025]
MSQQRMRRRWLVWVSMLLLLTIAGLAQPSDVSFLHYSTDNGLSNNVVTSVLKDRQGFMWFGTVNGLNRFDGLRFTVYKRTGRPDGLPGNYIVNDGLSLDADGFVWISTNRGLCQYNPQTDRFQAIPLPQQRDQVADNDFVSPVRFDRAGMGWFASVDRLYRLEPRTHRLTAFPVPSVLPNAFAIPIPDRQGQVWLHHWSGLYRFDPTTRRYTYYMGADDTHPKAPERVYVLTEDKSGQVYALLDGGRVTRFDPASNRFVTLFTCPGTVTALEKDRLPDGREFFWLGSFNKLIRYIPADKRFTQFTHNASDPLSFGGGTIGVMQTDPHTGIVWIGTTEGIAKIDPVSLKFSRRWLPASADGAHEMVEVIRQDRRNDELYWILGNHTLYQWNRRSDSLKTILINGTAPRNDPAMI